MRFELVPHQLNEDLPLIYMWEIHSTSGELMGRYVGKAKSGANRPLKHYRRNVSNILQGKPYRKHNPSGFRRIHHALASAQAQGYEITLQFLCNVSPNENINEVEQKYIQSMKCSGEEAWQLNG
jgi:hypothetical protein